VGAGVSTDGLRVAGVPMGVDAWVKTFVAKKARSAITDIVKRAVSHSDVQFLPKCVHGLPWAQYTHSSSF